MNSLKISIYYLILLIFFSINLNAQDHVGDFTATGDVTAQGGQYFIGSNNFKRISNFNLSAISYFSDHENSAGFRLLTNEQELLGALSGQNNAFGLKDSNGNWVLVNSTSGGYTSIKANNTTAMTLHDSGKIQIGNVDITSSEYKLFVEQGILAESLRVALNGEEDWSDFVFDDQYDLMPLEDVRTFIEENNHLPDVPSAEKMVENGLDVLESDAILLQKIEEAYLYILEQQEQIASQNKQIIKQQNQIQKIEQEVINLKNQANDK